MTTIRELIEKDGRWYGGVCSKYWNDPVDEWDFWELLQYALAGTCTRAEYEERRKKNDKIKKRTD